jgi:aryl-alcohol dehydrogenase-like predicted oxidoreductase
MAAVLGLGVLAWGTLDGGVLTGKYTDSVRGPRRYGEHLPGERKARVAAVVGETAAACDASRAQVCIAWVLAQRKLANVIPILGARTASQLADNLGALDLKLEPDMLASLDEATAIQMGFPSAFLADDEVVQLIFGTTRELIAT